MCGEWERIKGEVVAVVFLDTVYYSVTGESGKNQKTISQDSRCTVRD
jgi:hypothetical protein